MFMKLAHRALMWGAHNRMMTHGAKRLNQRELPSLGAAAYSKDAVFPQNHICMGRPFQFRVT